MSALPPILDGLKVVTVTKWRAEIWNLTFQLFRWELSKGSHKSFYRGSVMQIFRKGGGGHNAMQTKYSF